MYPDQIDQANELAEMERTAAAAIRKPYLPAIGSCHFCSHNLSYGVFCDSDCRDDYEKAERSRVRCGSSEH
jgi:hypothetical protein